MFWAIATRDRPEHSPSATAQQQAQATQDERARTAKRTETAKAAEKPTSPPPLRDKPNKENLLPSENPKKENVAPPADPEPKVSRLFTCTGKHIGPVSVVCVSRDGKRVVSLDADNLIRQWNLDQRHNFMHHNLPEGCKWFALALFPDDKRVLTARELNVLCDMELGAAKPGLAEPYRGHTGTINSVDLTSDGKRAISCSDDRSIRLWDVDEKSEIRHWIAHDKPILFVRFSSEGKRALTRAADGAIRLWDVETEQRLLSVKSRNESALVSSAAIASDGESLVLGLADGTARLYDCGRKAGIARLEGHRGSVHTAIFSPSGRYLVTVGGEDKSQTAFLWYVEKDKLRSALLELPPLLPMALAFTSDSRRIVVGGKDGRIRVWEIRDDAKRPKLIAANLTGESYASAPNDPVIENAVEKAPMVKVEQPAKKPAEPKVEKPAEKPADPVVSKPPVKPIDPKPPAEKPSKPTLPEESAVAEAVKAIHAEHKEEYGKLQTKAAAKALAVKLLEEGRQLKNDPVKRFALYREARNLAARASAPDLSLKVAEALARDYPLNLLEAKVAALQQVGKSLDNAVASRAFLETALPLLKDAWARDDGSRK